ncbi:hypothetical protein IAE22_33570, partial [Bacillus sp. S34]|nr:hypothetical protein [Bacillus sp. S34]
ILDAVKPDVLHIQSHVVIGRGIVHEAHDRGIRVVATNHFMPENLLEYTPFGKRTLPIALKNRIRTLSHRPSRIDGNESIAVCGSKNDCWTAAQPGVFTTPKYTT